MAGRKHKKAYEAATGLLSLAEARGVYAATPSFQLQETRISGADFKAIGEWLKKSDIELGAILQASVATLYRQYKQDDIDLIFKDGLVNLLRVMDKGIKAFESEDVFIEWLFSRVENLGGQKPIDLLRLETGRREVEGALERIEYGVYG